MKSYIIFIILVVYFTNSISCESNPLQCLVSPSTKSCKNEGKIGIICPSINDCIDQFNESPSSNNQYQISIEPGLYESCPGNVGSLPNGDVTIGALDIEKKPVFECQSGETFLTYNQDQTSSFSQLSFVIIRDVIVNAKPQSSGNGGCIVATISGTPISENMLFLVRSEFNGCSTPGNGGLVYSNLVSVSFTNSTIRDSYAGGDGGVVFHETPLPPNTYYKPSLVSYNSTFINNQANGNGGVYSGFYSEFDWSTLIGNSANNGGVTSGYSNLFGGCSIEGNSAIENGGVSYSVPDTITSTLIQESLISFNSAGQNGGVSYSFRGGLYFYNNTVTQNSAGKNGGAIYFDESDDLSFTVNNFTYNKATNGGAIYMVLNSTFDSMLYYDSLFLGNMAYSQGGAIYFPQYGMLLGGIFQDNQSDEPTSQTFPLSSLTHVYIVNITVTSPESERVPYVLESGFTYWKAYGVASGCYNGIATLNGYFVQSCSCFSGWTGYDCNTPSH